MATKYHGSEDEETRSHTTMNNCLVNDDSPSIGLDKVPGIDAVYHARHDSKSPYFSTNSDTSVEMKLTSGGEALHTPYPAKLGRMRRSRLDKSSAVQYIVGTLCFLALVYWQITPFSFGRPWLPRVQLGHEDASKDCYTSLSESLGSSGISSKQFNMNSTTNMTRKINISSTTNPY